VDHDPDAWVSAEAERQRHRDEQLEQLTVTVASLVIARTEHAKAIRRLMATIGQHEEELATSRASIEDVRRLVEDLSKRLSDIEPASGLPRIRLVVHDIGERLTLIERALPVIENKLGLTRRPADWKRRARTPGES